ncbi:MAG: molybdenum cofactor guanylyltransferase [Desulfobacteraceae bacterium]|nr:molybdenum cofactor guanylyltransferase [Desulfobacteraceae bacterium]
MDRCCSGVILAGGRSSRFDGADKAFFELGGLPMIRWVTDLFCRVFPETMLVTNDPLRHLKWDVSLFSDLFPAKSSLTGIHAGLFYAQTPWIFVAACDTPFIRESVVDLVLSEIEAGLSAVIPQTPYGMEPLCAAYAKKSLQAVERAVRKEKFKINRAFKSLKVKKIPESRVMEADPELASFFNVNTDADLQEARAGLKRE